MRPVSDGFLAALTGAHRMIVRATATNVYQTGTAPAGERLTVLGGDVVLDGTADVRATLTLTVDGSLAWPTSARDLLSPYGSEIYVERGIAFSDIEQEWVGLGYFRIDSLTQPSPAGSPIAITGSDRMAGIRDAQLEAPQEFAIGTRLDAVVSALVAAVYPGAVITWDDPAVAARTLTRIMVAESDRYGAIDALVRAQGKVWYWDHTGALSIRSAPSATAPVWTVAAGRGGVYLNGTRSLSRAGAYNAVVASGEGADTGAPVRAVARDLDPGSPTYYYGRFGPVPRFFSSAFIATTTQASEAAAALLARGRGITYDADFSAVPNPALEPYDPVEIRLSGEGGRVHVIDSITIPLTAGAPMPVGTREQSITLA